MADMHPAPVGAHVQRPAAKPGKNAPAASAPPDLRAFFSLGFRPLYIAGCGWAMVSLAIWIFFPELIRQPLWGVAWHAHEMLWGFIATIAVGFLLTASATWTGFNPLQGKALAGLCGLWIIARIGYLVGGATAFHIALFSESLFFAAASLCLLRVIIKGKSRRNLGLPVLMLGLGVANALYALAAQHNDYPVLMQRFEQGLICMAVIALLIARRVIPFFAMRMVPGLQLPMLVRSGHAQMALGVAAIACGLMGWPVPMALTLGAAGFIGLWQVGRWQPQAVLRKPMLWILYLGYAALATGLIFAAVHAAGLASGTLARAAVHVHIIGIGGFSVLIIGMVTRTALGHLGRPLALDASMLASYGLMMAALVLRLAALAPGDASLLLLQASALCWIGCMALYLWRFVPMLVRPRPDGR